MKKTLLALTLVLCLVASLVALTSCGGGGDECDHIWATTATVDKAATCTEEGSESIKCLDCGEKKADSITAIPATGHEFTIDSTTAATCTTDGSKTEICTTCGDTTTTTIPATGEHTWSVIPTIDVEATCTTDGSKSIKCTGCQTVKPDSTEVIPAAHVWGVIATPDTLPTCTEAGTKSIKCFFCQTKQDGTEQTIPATGHTGLTIIVPATFFSEGLAEGTCSTCGEAGSATIPMTEVESYLFTTSTGDKFYAQQNINTDVLDGDHFYPTEENPDGKDLYVELSFLYNPTLHTYDNGVGNHYFYFGMFDQMNVTGPRRTAYHLLVRESPKSQFWCEHIGGFEPHYNDTVTYGPSMKDKGAVTDFPNIGEYGWHRLGFHYHQTTKKVNGAAKHSIEVTMYIDGVKISSYYTVKDEGNDYPNLLYTAEYEGDKLVYTGDSPDETFIFPYMIGDCTSLSEMYFVVADVYITAGDGFVMNVKPVENPEEKTYSPAEGVELDGKIFFEVATNE